MVPLFKRKLMLLGMVSPPLFLKVFSPYVIGLKSAF